jgi:hypothetical protein
MSRFVPMIAARPFDPWSSQHGHRNANGNDRRLANDHQSHATDDDMFDHRRCKLPQTSSEADVCAHLPPAADKGL